MCLFGVLLAAKACALAGRDVPALPWTPVAFLWQDVAAVLLFAGADALVRRAWVGWAAYAGLSAYAAVNVPVERVLSTPLTGPLLRAARGPLADSITAYATWDNVGAVLVVLAVAAGLPWVVRLWQPGPRLWCTGAGLGLVVVALGPVAGGRVETLGLHRNVLAALLVTPLPRPTAGGADEDFRATACPEAPAEDLTRFRGAAAGRNVLLVALESTGARYLRPYGAAEDPMPHVTDLAGRAVLFENAYAAYPESIKGLYAVLCSTFPALGTTPEDYGRLPCPSLARVLVDADYRTGMFHSGRFGYLGMEAVVRGRGFDTLEDAGDIGGDRQSSFGLDDERVAVRRVLRWIDGLPAGRRWFVHYLPVAGHHPYTVPEPGPFPPATDLGRYRNALLHADVALGELLAGLRARGLERNTLVVVHGDHGEAFGQHAGNFGHTLFVYEENVRVPLLLAAPGLARGPVRVRRPASLVDVAPTVLDLLGLPAPAAYQGRSLLAGLPRVALFLTDYSLPLVGLRDGRWKLIYDLDGGRSKLFDLEADPGEGHDLSAAEPARTAAYRDRLLRWAAAQRGYVGR